MSAEIEALETALALPDAEPPERCVCCGGPGVAYWNYLAMPFCWPCADGQCSCTAETRG
jgi:hypothetical protein